MGFREMVLCVPWRRKTNETIDVEEAENSDRGEKRLKTPSWDEEAASPAKRKVTQQVRSRKPNCRDRTGNSN